MAKCPNCGKEVSEGFRFCTNCGEKLEPIETAQSVEPAAEAVEEAPVTEPAAETAAEAPMTESAEETVTEPTKEAPAPEVPVSAANEVPVSEAVNEVPVSESAVELPEEIQVAEPAPEPVSEVPIAPMMEEAAYREPARAPGNDGQSRETPEEKKKQPPYFLIGVAAVVLVLIIGFVALGKVFGGLNPMQLLGGGTPGQKFLGYQVNYFNGKLKAMEEIGLLRMEDNRALTFTVTGEVKGNKEVAEYLEDSSIVLKTKSNLDKGNLQASLLVKLTGNSVLDAYGEYDNGNLSFAFPSIDKTLYKADVKAWFENATGEDVQLPDLKKIKENRKLGKKLLSKYGLLLSKSITKKNLTTEKGTFTIEHLDEDLKDAKYKGTRYTFKPKAEEIEQFVEKLADMVEKDKDLEKFIEQGAYGKYLGSILGYGRDDSAAEQLSDLADILRDRAEEIGENEEENGLTWVVGVEGKTLHEIYLFSDDDDNGELDTEEEAYVVLASGKDKDEVAEFFNFAPYGDYSTCYIWNTYKKKGKTLDGTITGMLDTLYLNKTDYTIETGKKYQILPYGEYKFRDIEGDNGKVTLTVKAGKKNSTDCELKMSGLSDLDYNDIRSMTLHINVKEGADISKPKGKTEDITDYSVYELYDLMGEFSSEIENIGEEIFGG